MTSPEFSIEIHKSAGYTPTPEVLAAIEALALAVAAEDGDEVTGFGDPFAPLLAGLSAPQDSNFTICARGRYAEDGRGGTICTGVYGRFP
jgi:hypothetical protein